MKHNNLSFEVLGDLQGEDVACLKSRMIQWRLVKVRFLGLKIAELQMQKTEDRQNRRTPQVVSISSLKGPRVPI